jgi:hypothetical protein
MGKPISQDEFNDLLRTFERSAFRLETRERYALGYERDDFQRFLDGRPTPPPLVGWWQPWLEQIARFGREGKTIARVRVLAEPPPTTSGGKSGPHRGTHRQVRTSATCHAASLSGSACRLIMTGGCSMTSS